jgi:uncharacterized membrane-anchored protein YitT (DUF2179 family)
MERMYSSKLIDYLYILVGIILISVSISVFYSPNNIVVGGFSGLGIVILHFTNIPVSISNIALNIPLFIVALKVLGKKYVIKSWICAVLLSVWIQITTYLPAFRGDLMLIAIYGGIIDGIGCGLVLRGMSSTGGVDLLAAIIHKKKGYIPIAVIMFTFNVFVIALGFFVFGAEKALYAIISSFVSGKAVNIVLMGLNFSKAAFIISDKSDEISEALMGKLHRGVTSFRAEGAYTGKNKNVLLCVFSHKEIVYVKSIVRNIDKKSFMIFTDVKEVVGEGFSDIEIDK